MIPLTSFVQRFGRPLRIGVQVSVLVIILAALGTVGFVEYSAQPGFCDNCHIMEPYYESWATSSHKDVKCIECHYAPGLKAEAMGKLQAANQVVKYITGAYGMKPWAEIEDAACLRSGCHSLRKVEGVVDYKGIRFSHTTHLGQLRRGKQLRCTSCHSQIVQGDHLRVTEATCYLCHFKGSPGSTAGVATTACVDCHESPPRFVSPAGFVVDHPQYVSDLVSCLSCHEQVTMGSGAAEKSRCFNCHNEPERVDQFANTTMVHRVHIAVHNVECTQCHVPIEHRLISLQSTPELDCAACHRRVHDEQQRMYAGMGGHGTEQMPSSMYLANVTCSGCHELSAQTRGHEEVKFAGEASCLSCHGIRYANILPSWQKELERRVGQVERVVRGAEERMGTAPVRSRAVADSLVQLARENLEFVRRGKGAHNLAFADELLRSSVKLVQQAVADGGIGYRVPRVDLGSAISENVCLQCHLGIERQAVEFRGRSFKHESHVVNAGIPCASCHSSLEEHGQTLLDTSASCDGCHHARVAPKNCAQCHAGPGGAPAAALTTSTGDFTHAPHREAGLACNQCHTAPEMSAAELECQNCHEPHHQPEASCLSCHREGVQSKHPQVIAHSQCTQCHGSKVEGITEWSREVCSVCHADRTEHYAPVACQNCHQVPPLGPAPGEADDAVSSAAAHTNVGTPRMSAASKSP